MIIRSAHKYMKYTETELVDLIITSNLKNTPHRLAVLARIAKAKLPIAVHKIIEDLRKKHEMDQATVYRNLVALEEAKIIKRFDYNHGHAHYEMDNGEENHKIICKSCETIEKIEASYFDIALKKIVKKSKKFKSSSLTSVEIYGQCKSCS
jgi:Fur family transcriptional regulator, ferric uptake regulator